MPSTRLCKDAVLGVDFLADNPTVGGSEPPRASLTVGDGLGAPICGSLPVLLHTLSRMNASYAIRRIFLFYSLNRILRDYSN